MRIAFLSLFVSLCACIAQASARINPVGAWQSNCVVFGRHSYISLLRFSENKIIAVIRFFETKECTSLSIIGTYEGNYYSQGDYSDVQQINHRPISAKFTLHLPRVVEFWNDVTRPDGCGLKNWIINEAQEVLGRYCRPFDMPLAGSVVDDRISIKGEELRLGRSPAIVGKPNENSELPDPIYRRIH